MFRNTDFFELIAQGHTFHTPFSGKKLGLSDLDIDFSLHDEYDVDGSLPATVSSQNLDENNDIEDTPYTSIMILYIHDPTGQKFQLRSSN